MAEHPNAFRLEAWHAGAMDEAVDAHVGTCAICQAYVDGLAGERAALHARLPPADFARQVRAAAERTPRRRRVWPVLIGLGAAAAAVVLLLPSTPPTPRPVPDQILLKGALELAIVVRRAGTQTQHRGTATVKTGDGVRIVLTCPAAGRYVVGLLQDGAWTPLEDREFPAGRHVLDASFTADDQPGVFEFIAGPVAAVEAARRTGARDGVASLRVEQIR